jgi:Leucine-rich repeat (LRR) protein
MKKHLTTTLIILISFFTYSQTDYFDLPKNGIRIDSTDNSHLDSLYLSLYPSATDNWYDTWSYGGRAGDIPVTKADFNVVISNSNTYHEDNVVKIKLTNNSYPINNLNKYINKFKSLIVLDLDDNSVDTIQRIFATNISEYLFIKGNKLNFDELLYANSKTNDFYAADQDTVNFKDTINLFIGDKVTLYTPNLGGKAAKLNYEWYLESNKLDSIEGDSSYNLLYQNYKDTGEYWSYVTHDDLIKFDEIRAAIPTVVSYVKNIPPSAQYDSIGLRAMYENLTISDSYAWPVGDKIDAGNNHSKTAQWGGVFTEIYPLEDEKSLVDSIDLSSLGIKGTIPYDIRYIGKLRHLNLNDNLIDSVHESLNYFQYIDSVKIDSNKLTFDLLENLIPLRRKIDTRFTYKDQDTTYYANLHKIVKGGYWEIDKAADTLIYLNDTAINLHIKPDPIAKYSKYKWFWKFKDQTNFTEFTPTHQKNDTLSVLVYKEIFVPTNTKRLDTLLNFYAEIINDSLPNLIMFTDTINIVTKPSSYTDSIYLAEFYHAAKGPSWTPITWNLNTPFSSWAGKTIDPVTGRVTAINLPNNNLDSVISEALVNLDSLRTLDIRNNNLDSAQVRLLEMPSIDTIDISMNEFTFNSLEKIHNIHNFIDKDKNRVIKYDNQKYIIDDSLEYRFEGTTDTVRITTNIIGIDYVSKLEFILDKNLGWDTSNIYKSYRPRYKDTLIVDTTNYKSPYKYTDNIGFNERNISIRYYYNLMNSRFPKLIFSDSATIRPNASPYTDSIALKKIYADCGGASWTWPSTGCIKWDETTANTTTLQNKQWCGIDTILLSLTTGHKRYRVYRLNLKNYGLTGNIPKEIGYLDAIKTLNLDSNNITSLPKEIRDVGDVRKIGLPKIDPKYLWKDLYDFYLDSIDVRHNKLDYASINNLLAHGEFNTAADYTSDKLPYDNDGEKIDGICLFSPQKGSSIIIHRDYESKKDTLIDDDTLNVTALTKFQVKYDNTTFGSNIKLYHNDIAHNIIKTGDGITDWEQNFYTPDLTYFVAEERITDPGAKAIYNNGRYSNNGGPYLDPKDTLNIGTAKAYINFVTNFHSDSIALRLLNQETGLKTNWHTETDTANWNYVKFKNGRVDSIGLNDLQLTGKLPMEMSVLDSMRYFSIDNLGISELNFNNVEGATKVILDTLFMPVGFGLYGNLLFVDNLNVDTFIIANNKFSYSSLDSFDHRYNPHPKFKYWPQNFNYELRIDDGVNTFTSANTPNNVALFSNLDIDLITAYNQPYHNVNYVWYYDTLTSSTITPNTSSPRKKYEVNKLDSLRFHAHIRNATYPLLNFNTDTLRFKTITNLKSDSIALVRFIDSVDNYGLLMMAPNWYEHAERISTSANKLTKWDGITITGDRVTSVDLANRTINAKITHPIGFMDALETFDISNNQIYDLDTNLIKLLSHGDLSLFDLRENHLFYDDFTHLYSHFANYSDFSDTIKHFPQNIKPIDTVDYRAFSEKLININNTNINNAFANDSLVLTIKNVGADSAFFNVDGLFIDSTKSNNDFIFGKQLNFSPDTTTLIYRISSETFKNLHYYDTLKFIQLGTRYTDSLFLVDLYNSTYGATKWTTSTNWLSNQPIEDWYGVKTYKPNGRLETLNLKANNLDSLIPKTIYYLDTTTVVDLSGNNIDTVSTGAFLISKQLRFDFGNNEIKNLHKSFFKNDSSWKVTSSLDSNYFDFKDFEDLGSKIIDSLSYKNQYTFFKYNPTPQLIKIGYNDSSEVIAPEPDNGVHNVFNWEIWVTRNGTAPDSVRRDSNELVPLYRDSALQFVMDSLWNINRVKFFKDTFKLFAEVRNDSIKLSQSDVDGYDVKSGNFYRFLVANILFEKNRRSDSIALSIIKDSIEYKSSLATWIDGNDLIPDWKGVGISGSRVDSLKLDTTFFGLDTVIIGKVPKIIGELDSLRVINFRGNRIDTMPTELSNLDSLETIDLAYNGLEAIEFEAWNLQNIDTIDLTYNYLTFADLLPLKDSMDAKLGNFNVVGYANQIYDKNDTLQNDSLRRGFMEQISAKLIDDESKYMAYFNNGSKAWNLTKNKANKNDTSFNDLYWNYPDDTLDLKISAEHTDLPLLKFIVRDYKLIDYQGSKQQDSTVLIQMKAALTPTITSWKGDDLSTYEGVTTRVIHGEDRVVKLDLSNKNLNGNINQYIMDLVKLDTLILSGNQISSISDSIKYLYPKLKYVDLSDNKLTTIGPGFHWIDSINYFKVDSNKIDLSSSLDNLDTLFRKADSLSIKMNGYNFTKLSNLYSSFNDINPAKTDSTVWMPQDTLGKIDTLQGDLRVINMITEYGTATVGTTKYNWENLNTLSSTSKNIANNKNSYELHYTHADSGWYFVSGSNDLLGTLEHHHIRVVHPPKIFGGDYYEAFKDIYNTTDGVNWIDEYKWTDTIYEHFNVDNFKGIKIKYGRITSMKFDSINMNGTIAESFNKLWDMDTIIMSHNNLEFHENALLNFVNLEHLDIHRSNLSSLPNMSDLASLKSLDASFGQIGDISGSNISNVSTLEHVNLSNNKIPKAPSFASSSTSIKTLDLSSNSINDVTALVATTFDNLESVDLSSNSIGGDIKELKMPAATNINLSDNAISNFSLSSTTNPKELKVSNNAITAIPVKSNLVNLVAYNNQINNIDISAANNIEIINLAWNNLESISLNDLPKLRGLIINNNLLKSLNFGSDFNKSKLLEKVHLHNNQLDSIPTSVDNPQYLTMQNNNLTFKDIIPFKDIDNLGYAPQNIVGVMDTLVLDSGATASLKIDSFVNHASNKYQWYYYETVVNEEKFDNDNKNLNFDPSFNPIIHAGVYYYKVTNELLPKLTLEAAIKLVKNDDSTPNNSKHSVGGGGNKAIKIDNYWPNPFKEKLTIQYNVYRDTRLNISVYNSAGNKVATLRDEYCFKGFYFEELDGLQHNLNYGVHFIVISTETEKSIIKVIFIK